MTSHIRVGRGSKIAPQKGRYRVGQGRLVVVGQNWQKMRDVINECSPNLNRGKLSIAYSRVQNSIKN